MRFSPLAALCLCLMLLPLAACYRPVYGAKEFGAGASAAESRLNQVAIANIPDANGQKLRNLLIDRFYGQGRPLKPDYELKITLTMIEEKLAIQKDATASRARLELTAAYTLVSNAPRRQLFSGLSRSSVSYNILNDQFATLAAKENAAARGVQELADLITTRTLLALEGGGADNSAGAPPAKAAP